MQCMKCGQDVEEPNVFCETCRENMKHYPVRPGTVVQLPKYQEPYTRRQTVKRKQPPTLEEQMNRLRLWCRILAAALAVTLLLLLGAGYLLLRQEEKTLLPGQNYSTATDSEPGNTER